MMKTQPQDSSSSSRRTTPTTAILAGILMITMMMMMMIGAGTNLLHMDKGGATTASTTTTSTSSLKLLLRSAGDKESSSAVTSKAVWSENEIDEEVATKRRELAFQSPSVLTALLDKLNAEEEEEEGKQGQGKQAEGQEDSGGEVEVEEDLLMGNLTTRENVTVEEVVVTPAPSLSIEPTQNPTAKPTPLPTVKPTNRPTIEPFGPIDYVGNDATGFYAPFPLGVCQGDCDSDQECDTSQGLYCHQRNAYEEVPGCTFGPRGEGRTTTSDFCAWNATSGKGKPVGPAPKYEFGSFEYVGNDGTWYATYPLPVCRGDCDNDDDCAPGLFCYNRNPYTPIPGCTGGAQDDTTADVCIWNATLLDLLPQPAPEPPEEAFRLKLYWEEGYMWQNETFEREWCMSYNYDGYPGTGGCWYARDFMNCTSDQVYVALCIEEDPRQWFKFVELGTQYNNDGVEEVMIKTVGDTPLSQWKKARCFERQSSKIVLTYDCDRNNPNQRFFALNGDLNGYRFELGQYSGYTLDNCVANAHHPKSGEVVEFHICEEARKEHDQTSYWEKFPAKKSDSNELVTQAEKSLPVIP